MLYLDYYLWLNFLMDLLLLWGTGRICKRQCRWKRLMGAAVVGAFYSGIGLFVPLSGVVHILVMYVGMSLLLCRVGFSLSDRRELGKESVVFCLLAFVTGGALDSFYYGIGGVFSADLPGAFGVILLGMAVVGSLIFGIRRVGQERRKDEMYAEVELVFPEGTVVVIGLFDTGNRLKVNHQPVGILEEAAIDEKMNISDGFPVFYQSVGKKDGVLTAKKAGRVRLRGKEREWTREDALVAFSREKLSSDGSYQMLLPIEWRDMEP